MESRPSRWDALSDDGPSSSSSCSSSSRRRPKKLSSNSNCGGHCRPEERGIQRGATTISPQHAHSYSGGNWRRRAAANDDGKNGCIPPNVSEEEEKLRGALKQLQIAIGSFLEEDEGNVDSKERENCVHHSIEQLSTSLFDASPEEKSTKILPNISNAVIWEVAYMLLRQLQLLSQSKGSKNTCRQLLKSIASVTLVCLQSLINNQQQLLLQEGRPTRTKAVTDVRLCESASILLDTFGCPLFNDDDDAANQSEIILCKETLLSCLAKILAISTMTSQKNTRESRGPLFPWGAEKAVNLVVKQTALPFLELLDKGSDEKVNSSYGAMECLYLLLQDLNWDSSSAAVAHDPKLSKHAAAILAPLVVDVSPDGRENQRVNPLRSRTLIAISAFWGWAYELTQCGEQSSIESKDPIMVSCQCMTAALNALSALRKSKVKDNQSANVCEIDVATIARQLHSMLQNDGLRSFRPNFFNLLSLLCTAYPSPSAGQWHLFLEKSGVKASPLLSILEDSASALGHKKVEDEAVSASLPYALHAMSEMLSVMPFTLWISGGGETRSSRRISGGNFSSRVRNAVLNVINCIFDLMTAVKCSISGEWLSNKSYPPLMEDVMVQISQVAGKLCTDIPFNGENSGLRQPASRLVQCAADIYVQSAKLIVMESELDHTISYKAMSSFGAVIRESLGVDSAPAEKWLASASSYEFIGLLLTDACWKCPSSKDRMEMLSFVAKRSPLTLAREPFNLASFCEVCAVQCRSENDADSRILGLKLIESFILGRKESLTQCSSNSMVMSVVPETFCPLLHVALEDHSADVRACAVSAFGSLLKHDWVALLLPNVDRIDWTYLESILRLCTANEETSANVRGCSCKAVGLVATTCIGGMPSGEEEDCIQFSSDFVLSFTCKICEVMLNALTDKNASVRSMALFAAGNTGLALKENATENSTPPHPSLKCLFLSVCACLADKDEKVGNQVCFLKSCAKVVSFLTSQLVCYPGRGQCHQKHQPSCLLCLSSKTCLGGG